MTYYQWCKKFPSCVVIKKEGYFFSAHGDAAELISYLTGYKLGIGIDGLYITGSPITSKMIKALEEVNASFIVVDGDDSIIDKNDGVDFRGIPQRPLTKEERIKRLTEQREEIEKIVNELNRCSMEINRYIIPGNSIVHTTFGNGKIILLTDGKVTVEFPTKGIKILGLYQSLVKEFIEVEGLSKEYIQEHSELLNNKDQINFEYNSIIRELEALGGR